MSPYRTPAAKPKSKYMKPRYVMTITVWFVSGEHVSFDYEPMNNGWYDLKTHFKNTHEMFITKWDPEDRHSRAEMKTGVVCYSKDNKQHVINLKLVEYYSVEAIQMSEPEEKAV